MKHLNFKVLIVGVLLLNGCGGGNTSSTATEIAPEPDLSHPVNISGKITYDLVPVNSNHIGLDYSNIRKEVAKLVTVEAIDSTNQVLDSTVSDINGNYTVEVALNSQVKIRVYAKMFRSGNPGWNVRVEDNTNSNALYVMEGVLALVSEDSSTRNLNASSGWDGTSYTSERVAAPFAMLDSVYQSIAKVLTAESNAVFEPLKVNWSIHNKSFDGDPANGDIGTSYYFENNLFILGDANADTDEYDDHVIAHEWAHYYEDTFSRSDSVGGAHSDGDRLDIRVAFGEGWGNAFSAMALNDPLYFDTFGVRQSDGFSFNVETEVKKNPGWYSEGSIQRILYDLYDNSNDGDDLLSLGFAPLHQVFTGAQKNTPAFTSIFTFTHALKAENPTEVTAIERIVSGENIAVINDIYGNGRTNLSNETPLYIDLTIGTEMTFCPSYTYGSYNMLGNRKYIRFNVDTTDNYTITVEKSTNSGTTDPDFYLHNISDHTIFYAGEDAEDDKEEKSLSLPRASYLLDVYDYEAVSNACFSISVN